jgi:hypothetical protein
MSSVEKVGGGVFIERIVTAPDVPAGSTTAKMHPPAAGGVALEATFAAGRSGWVDTSFKVHDFSLSRLIRSSHHPITKAYQGFCDSGASD